jgi:hypothetical protein
MAEIIRAISRSIKLVKDYQINLTFAAQKTMY